MLGLAVECEQVLQWSTGIMRLDRIRAEHGIQFIRPIANVIKKYIRLEYGLIYIYNQRT